MLTTKVTKEYALEQLADLIADSKETMDSDGMEPAGEWRRDYYYNYHSLLLFLAKTLTNCPEEKLPTETFDLV